MPVSRKSSRLADQIASAPVLHHNKNPLWSGPGGEGWNGGVTQSMICRFLSCRERFRLRYVCGLDPHERWNHRIGYGNMWHSCEEAHAAGRGHEHALALHADDMVRKYPMQRDDIVKWANVCAVQFPEYVNHWASHPDVLNRTPLMQEQVFDVPYALPSGRTVRLRGRWDSVDLIDGGIYLQENKTKGDIERVQLERQLRFDLQTMMYLVALYEDQENHIDTVLFGKDPILGVRYNVVRRPFSGGKGSIKQGEGTKGTKCNRKSCRERPSPECDNCHGFGRVGAKPAETDEEFYERLRRDYIAAEPDYWFFRIRAEVSERDLKVFQDTCLDPILETMCAWYDQITGVRQRPTASFNYRTPFGVFSALEEGGATEYDAYLDTGSEVGLRRVDTLFSELQ